MKRYISAVGQSGIQNDNREDIKYDEVSQAICIKITNIIEDEINYHPEFATEFTELIYRANSRRCDCLVYFYATSKKELVVAIDPYDSGLLGCAAYSCNRPGCRNILLGRLPSKVKAKLMNYLLIIGQELEHLGFTLLTPIKPNPYYYTTCTAKVIPPSN